MPFWFQAIVLRSKCLPADEVFPSSPSFTSVQDALDFVNLFPFFIDHWVRLSWFWPFLDLVGFKTSKHGDVEYGVDFGKWRGKFQLVCAVRDDLCDRKRSKPLVVQFLHWPSCLDVS